MVKPEQHDRVEWAVPVLDAVLGERRQLVVAVSDTRVVVVPPAAVGYVVPPESIPIYCGALQAANNVAEHRKTRGDWAR